MCEIACHIFGPEDTITRLARTTLLLVVLLFVAVTSGSALARSGGGHGGGGKGGGGHGHSGGHKGGHGGSHNHSHRHHGAIVGGAVFLPWYFYPPPDYYYRPPVEIPDSPPGYIEQGTDLYYCVSAQSYYPDVKECPGGWQAITPEPASSM